MNSTGKVHPYLFESWPRRRAEMLMERAERLVAFELVSERTVEDHFDEDRRLRLHRVIEKQVLRGGLTERYAKVLLSVADGGTPRSKATEQLAELLGEDAKLRPLQSESHSMADVLAGYERIVPVDQWPALLCMAPAASHVVDLKADLEAEGFRVQATPMERFGIVKVACPPELAVVDALAQRAAVRCMADPESPVPAPPLGPGNAVRDAVDVNAMLGVTTKMQDEDAGLSIVAVLDTGLDLSHPAFRRVAPSDYRNFTRWSADDEHGHGTHVSFIAGGGPVAGHRRVGVAPKCRLVAAKVMQGDRFATIEQILEAMAWAVFEKGADVMSLSLGEDATPANGQSIWTRACDESFNQGTIVCVAAGNLEQSTPETIVVPADAQTAVAVGAIDAAGRLAAFSAMGSPHDGHPLYGKPNCVAPGVMVQAARSSACADGAGLMVTYSGTSMAAPAVAGCLALLKSRARQLGWEIPPARLLEIFYASCRPVETEGAERYSAAFEVGHGLVDMQRAMAAVEREAPYGGKAGPLPARGDGPRPDETGRQVRERPTDTRTFAANTCYFCGHHYLSEVPGIFSDAQQCSTCGAPLCKVCWKMGERGCAAHPQTQIPTLPMRPVEAVPVPPFGPGPAAEPGVPTMVDVETPNPCDLDPETDRLASVFLAAFGETVRDAALKLVHPGTGQPVKLRLPLTMPKLRFGNVECADFTGSLFGQSRIQLIALTLAGEGLQMGASGCVPADSLLRMLTGANGLDFKDKTKYAVGIYSPVGWPANWTHAALPGVDAELHLVSAADGVWTVVSPRGSEFRVFFDPDHGADGQARAQERAGAGLEQDERLRHASDQVSMDDFCSTWSTTPEAVRAAVDVAGDRFMLVTHRGRTVVQRRHR